MIQPLRRSHFGIWVALPLILAVLFVAGLVSRRTAQPPNAEWHWQQYRAPVAVGGNQQNSNSADSDDQGDSAAPKVDKQ